MTSLDDLFAMIDAFVTNFWAALTALLDKILNWQFPPLQ